MAKQVDLLQGNITKSLTMLALPIMGSQLVQMAYNMVDMIWIGRVNAGAVAAVGAAGMFLWLSNGLIVLARMGGQVLVAQSIGADDMKKAGRYAAAALQLAAVMAVVYTLLMVLFATPLIGFFNLDSPEVIKQAEDYLRITGLGTFFSFANIVLVAIITATGNSRTPFLTTLWGLGFNMVLDPLLIFGIGPFPQWGAAGAAVATTLAQVIVFALLASYAVRDEYLFPHVKLTRPATGEEIRAIFKISLPVTLMQVAFPIISMVLARMVAAWGDGAVAVQKIGSQIESISWMMGDGFAAAASSFVAQNYGADNIKRAKKGAYVSFGLITVWGALCTALLVLFPGPVFSVFLPGDELLSMGIDYLVILGFSELFICWEILCEGIYSGFGRTKLCSGISFLLTVGRLPAAALLSATALGLNGIWWSISVSSILKGLFLSVALFLFMRKLTRKPAQML